MDFYPRPQLQRAEWLSLNGAWRFCFDDACAFSSPEDVTDWTHEITVPFPPESVASGIGDTGFHPSCWYERDFELTPADDRVILRFGAVDYSARVWINGDLAVTHEGGHTPFWADITTLLDPSGHQTIAVLAVDIPGEHTQAARQAGLAPRAAFYLVSAHDWHLADGLDRAGRAHVRGQDPVDTAR